MKKFLFGVIALVMALSIFAGCAAADKPAADAPADAPAADDEAPVVYDYAAEDIASAIRDAYGENYLPDAPLDETMLSDMFGINAEDCESFVAEMPMIGVHPDKLIVIQAKEGKADAIEETLNTLRDNLIADTMQYPMNIAKINASAVLREGNYVAFLLLGAPNENMDASEAEAKAFAEEEMAKGIAAFEGMFK